MPHSWPYVVPILRDVPQCLNLETNLRYSSSSNGRIALLCVSNPNPFNIPLLKHLPHGRPAKQPDNSSNEGQYNDLVFPAISLKTGRKYILIICICADIQLQTSAEVLVARCACGA